MTFLIHLVAQLFAGLTREHCNLTDPFNLYRCRPCRRARISEYMITFADLYMKKEGQVELDKRRHA